MATKKAAAKSPNRVSENAEEKNRPFDTRVGRAVTLTWVNEKEIDGEMRHWRSIEAHTLYKNEKDEWENGTSYGASDVISAKASVEQALFDHHGGVDRELLNPLRAAVSLPRESHQPIKISCGAVVGLIWRNEKEDGTPWYSLTHSCRYRGEDEKGNSVMKNGKSYGRIEAHQLLAVFEEATKQFEKLQGSPDQVVQETKDRTGKTVE